MKRTEVEVWPVHSPSIDLPNFDRVARAYRWMEYLSLGPVLERVRFWALDAGWLDLSAHALVLGDGDGRFTARLMGRNRRVQVTTIDLSAEMLRLLERRCAPFRPRLSTTCGDAREFEPGFGADLVVTHFFLDCLEQDEVGVLVRRVAAGLGPGATWVVSEFQVPRGWLSLPSWLIVRGLYLAFRVLTGLKVTRLPEFARELRGCGFGVIAEKQFLGGLLVSQVWKATSL